MRIFRHSIPPSSGVLDRYSCYVINCLPSKQMLDVISSKVCNNKLLCSRGVKFSDCHITQCRASAFAQFIKFDSNHKILDIHDTLIKNGDIIEVVNKTVYNGIYGCSHTYVENKYVIGNIYENPNN